MHTPNKILRIIAIVSVHFDVSVAELNSPDKTQRVSEARTACYVLARRHTRHSFRGIGEACGDRDHSTVVKMCQRFARRLAVDSQLGEMFAAAERDVLAEFSRRAA